MVPLITLCIGGVFTSSTLELIILCIFQYFLPHFCKAKILNMVNKENQIITYPTGTPRRINVDSTSILRQYIEEQNSTNLHVISTYFFDVISLIEKSTSFPRTFFNVISLIKKSTLFQGTFIDVILLVEKSMLFPRTFFDVISRFEKSTLSPRCLWSKYLRCFQHGVCLHVSTCFFRRFFKLMKKLEEDFLCLQL